MSVWGRNCSTLPEYASCSSNINCRCLPVLHGIEAVCGSISNDCSQLTPCGGLNQDICFIPGEICVRLNLACSYPVCYPISFADVTHCPLLPPVSNTTMLSITTDSALMTEPTGNTSAYCRGGCSNGGWCSGPNTCTCAHGWSGSNCDNHDCPGGCLNGGSCVGPYNCICHNGWTGSNCQTYFCATSCQNGGTCTGPNRCTCPSGWTGSNCQTYFCATSCQNGGTCTGPNRCTCPPGWTGSSCQTYVCATSCQNGGTCTGPNRCTCPSGWIGSNCQTYYCPSGCGSYGWCIGPNICSCSTGWQGSRCDQVSASQCHNYQLNTDGTRHNSYGTGTSTCDDTTFTTNSRWTRFSGAAGTQIATSIVPINRCGAHATGYYTGSMPSPGVTVSGTVCYNWNSYSCYWSSTISVTNCNGFYVYSLSPPPACSLRYCTS